MEVDNDSDLAENSLLFPLKHLVVLNLTLPTSGSYEKYGFLKGFTAFPLSSLCLSETAIVHGKSISLITNKSPLLPNLSIITALQA